VRENNTKSKFPAPHHYQDQSPATLMKYMITIIKYENHNGHEAVTTVSTVCAYA